MSRDPHTLAGAYVLDAVDDPRERSGFEDHLSRCTECAEETRGLRETASRLGIAMAQEPPPALRDRVMAEIGLVRQVPPAVTPITRRERRPGAWWPRLATGLAAACLAAAVGFGVVAYRVQDTLDGERLGAQQVAAVLAAPDARTVRGKAGQATTGTVVMSRSQDKVLFFSSGLAPLPDSETYQLWRIGPDGAIPDRLTRPDASGRTPPMVLGDLGSATKVGVTVEPSGGSRQPTTKPLLLMSLPPA
ncbi:anti-sigma factor [Sphaerisporangium corydalis]|uniref:Regulator of SigK n=1 Tax=Sphaerisporangium corydalis TaxID=1441875 RepID=A0ABV9EGR4_9ACTN|nr:anti-sigma factor [Sphaerisporangium corydalis]